ncbi:hypothetical protein B9479_007875 [Cryptococcus floricola]|uniref:DH domain-containing protein n=1 Tax=Cryptococcus floricola TaxID=2591691 RepID=A0A5D3AJ08_9TREE|nr:hypothetical protein B9479_007875 [Cryptococcus floricola]
MDSGYPVTISAPRLSKTSTLGSSSRESSSEERTNQSKNPLVDLIDSEKVYLDRLSLIIRRAAGAWSRNNLPPPKLDIMFRCIEACLRANKNFGQKLKEIGPDPSNPQVLGDLLMRWIGDLEPAYRSYASNFLTGFDSYPPVRTNSALSNILIEISASSTPVPPLNTWSLDSLFVLPYTRLRYYRKLYARLLRSTKKGRSDHQLLMVATEKLDRLVETVESRLEIEVGDSDGILAPPEPLPKDQQLSQRGSSNSYDAVSDFHSMSHENSASTLHSGSENHSTWNPEIAGVAYPARQTADAQIPGADPDGASSTTSSDLELRIDTEKTIDLFTMQPKRCRLNMQPISLPFERSLRSSHDVSVYFTPTTTAQQIEHKRAHIFILSDLFLVAEWMDATDKAAKMQQVAIDQPERVGRKGPMPEMWLRYPPLAGKHLMVAEGHQANVLTVMIMRKETFVIHTESEIAKDHIMKDLIDCFDFALMNVPGPILSPPPRVDSNASAVAPTAAGVTSFPSPFPIKSSPSASAPPKDISGAMSILSHQLQHANIASKQGLQWPKEPTDQPHCRPPNSVPGLPPRGASLCTPSKGLPDRPQPGYSQTQLPVASQPLVPPIPRIQTTRLQPRSDLEASPINRHHLHSSSTRPSAPDLPDQWAQSPRAGASGLTGPSSHLNQPGATFHLFEQHPVEPPSAMFRNNFPGHNPSAKADSSSDDDTPPPSPDAMETGAMTGPASVSAQMKCKVFIKQSHQQWKPLGSGKLRLFSQTKGNVKQLVS